MVLDLHHKGKNICITFQNVLRLTLCLLNFSSWKQLGEVTGVSDVQSLVGRNCSHILVQVVIAV